MEKIFKNYTIAFAEDCFSVRIGEVIWFTLPVATAVDTKQTHDTDLPAMRLSVTEENGAVCAVYSACSNLWEEKVYQIKADESGFHYTVRVKGWGQIQQLRYFTGKAPVQYDVSGYLLPVAAHKNRQDCTYNIYEENEIGLGYFAPHYDSVAMIPNSVIQSSSVSFL